MKRILIFLLMAEVFLCTELFAANNKTNNSQDAGAFMNENTDVRMQNFLAKIRRGEEVNVVALGGSITTGFAAKNPAKEGWAGLTGEWLKKLGEKNSSKVNYYNRAVSGTDSAFAVARYDSHIKALNPDLLLLEFAMNDQWLDPKVRKRTYEAIIRRTLCESDCAILVLFVNERKAPYSSNQVEQQQICEYYHVPFVSWKECVQKEGSLSDFEKYFDGQEGIHPNNAGHAKIAQFLEEEIERVWKNLPSDSKIAAVEKNLPPALTDKGFEKVEYYGNANLQPVENEGWTAGSPVHNEWVSHGNVVRGWQCNQGGAELTFEVEGSSIGITYCESDQFCDAKAWVTKADRTRGPVVTLNCFSSGRKGYYGWAYKQLIDGNTVEKYTVHIICSKKVANGDENKFCNITGILAAKEK